MTAGKRSLAAALLIATLFFATRLPNLFVLPIHSDEGPFLSWSRGVRFDHRPYISVVGDEKKPLPFWIVAPFLPKDGSGLLQGRLFSMICGCLALLVSFFTARRYFGKQTAVALAALWLTSPLLFFHERMFLIDPLMGLWYALALWLSLQVGESKRTRDAALAGLVIGLALVTKSYAYFFLLLPPLALLVHRDNEDGKIAALARPLLLAYGVAALVFLAVMAYPLIEYQLGVFHDRRHFVTREDAAGSLLGRRGLVEMGSALWFYLKPPVLILFALGLWRAVRAKSPAPKFVAAAAALPLLALAAVAYIFHGRYLYFFEPALLMTAAAGAVWIAGKVPQAVPRGAALAGVLALFCAWPAISAIGFAVDPAAQPKPPLDHEVYFEGQTAGYGVKETAEFLRERANEGPISVFTTSHIGNVRDGLLAYLWYEPEIRFVMSWWAFRKPMLGPLREFGEILTPKSRYDPSDERLALDELGTPLAVIQVPAFPIRKFVELNPGARLVYSVGKPGGKCRILVFELE